MPVQNRIQVRRGTLAVGSNQWTTQVLYAGEIGYETDTGKFKIGDGSTAWNSLGYAAVLPSDLTENIQDIIGTNLIGTNGISVSYNDGTGNTTLSLSDPTIQVADITDLTATAAEINVLHGVTSSTTELNYVDITTLGTVQASKAVTADSNKDITGLRNLTASGTIEANTNITINGNNVATVSYVDSLLGVNDAMVFKGTIGTGGTVTSLPTTYSAGWTYRVITAGTYAGIVCEIGDLIIAIIDRSGSGNLNSDWTVAQTNIDGAVLSTRTLTAGNGLTGGGDLSSNRTFDVGAGDGISVTSNAVGVDSTVVRTSGPQTIEGSLTLIDSNTYTICYTTNDTILVKAPNTNLTTYYFLGLDGGGSPPSSNSADRSLVSRSTSQVKSDLSLNNVENTALSTWAGSGNITTVGTINSGTWNGNTIGASYGGTGQSSYTTGDILYASSSSALSKLSGVATGNTLISGGVGVAPSWGKIGLTTHVSGTLAVGNGGTGATSLTGILLGNGASAISTITTSTACQVLARNSANTAYEFTSTLCGLTIDGGTP